MAVRGRGDRDRIGRGSRRSRRSEAEVVTVVARRDHRNDAGVDDVRHGLHERVGSRLGGRPAAREVDHVHPVADCRLEGGDDLGRVGDMANAGRDVEDSVVADPGLRRDAREPGGRRMVASAGRARAASPGRDPGDVRAVERGGSVERKSPWTPGPRPGEAPGGDHLGGGEAPLSLGEARRVGEAARVEEGVQLVDPVVDDGDLHARAVGPGRGDERRRADHTRAAIERHRVADAGVEPGNERHRGQPSQLRVRQVDREAVEDDLKAPADARRWDRGSDRPRGGQLRGFEPCDVGPRGAALDVQPTRAHRAEEPRPTLGREGRLTQADDQPDPPSRMVPGHGDRSRTHAR